jgi:hypothetical protein
MSNPSTGYFINTGDTAAPVYTDLSMIFQPKLYSNATESVTGFKIPNSNKDLNEIFAPISCGYNYIKDTGYRDRDSNNDLISTFARKESLPFTITNDNDIDYEIRYAKIGSMQTTFNGFFLRFTKVNINTNIVINKRNVLNPQQVFVVIVGGGGGGGTFNTQSNFLSGAGGGAGGTVRASTFSFTNYTSIKIDEIQLGLGGNSGQEGGVSSIKIQTSLSTTTITCPGGLPGNGFGIPGYYRNSDGSTGTALQCNGGYGQGSPVLGTTSKGQNGYAPTDLEDDYVSSGGGGGSQTFRTDNNNFGGINGGRGGIHGSVGSIEDRTGKPGKYGSGGGGGAGVLGFSNPPVTSPGGKGGDGVSSIFIRYP